jgi:rhodanese-related sulfurtransferase
MKIFLNVLITTLLALVVMGASLPATAAEAQRMSKETLKAMTDNTDVVIIDVRSNRDWKSGDLKIAGAVREKALQTATWASKYDKHKTYVLYCA